MTPEQTELLDQAILRVLDANRTHWGLAPSAIAMLIRQFGFIPKPDLIFDRLDYLTAKELTAEVGKTVNRAARAWKITSQGITYLDEHGL